MTVDAVVETGKDHAGQPAGPPRGSGAWRWALVTVAALVIGGAAYLAITRADALMLDIAKLAGCF